MNSSKRKNLAACCAVSIFYIYFLIFRFSVPGLIITAAGAGILFLSMFSNGSNAYKGIGDMIINLAGVSLIVIPAVSLAGLSLPFGQPDIVGILICAGVFIFCQAVGAATRNLSLPVSVFRYVFLCGGFIFADSLIMDWTFPLPAVFISAAGVFAFFIERLHLKTSNMQDSMSFRHSLMFTYLSALFTLFLFLEISYPAIAEVFMNIIATLPLAKFRWMSIVLIILLAGAAGALCFNEDMNNPGVRDVKICLAAGTDAVLIPVFIKVNSFVSLVPALLLLILHICLFFGEDKKPELIKNKFSRNEIVFAAGSVVVLTVFRAFIEGEIFAGIMCAGIFFAVSLLIHSKELRSGLTVWVLILGALCACGIETAMSVSGDRRMIAFEILVFAVFLAGLIALNACNKELKRSCFPEKTLALMLAALVFILPVKAPATSVHVRPEGDKLKVEFSAGKYGLEDCRYFWEDNPQQKIKVMKDSGGFYVAARKGTLHIEFTDSRGRQGEKTYFALSREFTDYTVRGKKTETKTFAPPEEETTERIR